MLLLKITRLGHPKIRQGTEPVSSEELHSQEIQRLIDDMVETMRDANGVGIAAPQVHVSKQIIVVEVSPENPRYPNQPAVPLMVLLNPEITEHAETTEDGWARMLERTGFTRACAALDEGEGQWPRSSRPGRAMGSRRVFCPCDPA